MSKPVPIPLVAPIGARYSSLTVDSRLVNAFAEKGNGKEVWVYKRPGFKSRSTALPAGTARGLYHWQGSVYSIVDDTVYKDGVALTGTVVDSGRYSFTATLGTSPVLFFHNGTAGYTVGLTGTLAEVTDADFPPKYTPAVPLVAGAVYLNATTYVMDAKARIYNDTAAGNDPSDWPATLDSLVAQTEPDAGVCLAKQLVYVIAMKAAYSEAFYDAANAAGSPLAAVSGAKMNYGCKDARSVCDVGGDIYWISTTREGSVQVASISSLQIKIVSTPAIERILTEGDYTTVYSWAVRVEGHRFYGVTLVESNITLVYDVSTEFWYQWTDPNGDYLPYAFATLDTNGKAVFVHESTGETFNLDVATYGDDGVAFPVNIYTPNLYLDGLQEKAQSRLELLGDMVENSEVEVYFSDDDYATWQGPWSLDMSTPRPMISDLGSFSRRAFRFVHQADTSFRVERAVLMLAVEG